MILTAQIAGLGLMMSPSAGTMVLPLAVPDALTAQQAAQPETASPPLAAAPQTSAAPGATQALDAKAAPDTTGATTASAETSAAAPDAIAITPPKAPKRDCSVCGPVYATRDPLIGLNRIFYAINQPIDRFIIRPPAMVYKAVIPKPARDGVHNALANIYSPVTFVNDVLQLRPKRALNTLGRFIINSTLGIAGLFDVAKRKPFHMQGHYNNFSDTLAMVGMSAGPYLYLPVIGPTTFRDLMGAGGDTFTQPLLVNRVSRSDDRIVGTRRPRKVSVISSTLQLSTFGYVLAGLSALDRRADADEELKALKASSVDPYAALREAYLQSREADIAALKAKDGEAAPVTGFDDPLTDPAAQGTPAPATAPAPPSPPAR
ncbi:MAG: VacJ family lipoprotein [Sphingomonadales bacterium]|nr:VacJ family lipoprotein [Sphingomonadales bacterium]MDE2171695.1 VacJ family lipoprotein [Sphingomonadales bacterium]